MPFWSRRKVSERDLSRELQAHLDLEAAEQRVSGLSSEDAKFAAQRCFGNTSLTKENVRAAWGWTWVETAGQDLRCALRSLRASPVLAFVAVTSLGLGLGANTAIFSFVNALLLKQLPVPEPNRLVQLAEYENGEPRNTAFSLPMADQLNRRNPAFAGLFGRYPVRVNLVTDGASEPLKGELVTGQYFDTLQIKPALGRLLNQEDAAAGAANPVCVMSYSLWQSRFGGDPGILGRKVMLNAHPYSVVGVTQKGFDGSQLQAQIDMQIPVSRMGDFMGAMGSMWKSPGFSWLQILARLKPGVTLPQAQSAINPLARAISLELNAEEPHRQFPAVIGTYRLTDGSQGVSVDTTYATPLTILMGVVGLVLLIACANLANLLLARSNARGKEFAVRLSLGASRSRLVRQLMVESLALACLGGLLGLALAFWVTRTLSLYLNPDAATGYGLNVSLDPMAVGFSIALTLLTTLVFGLAPALQASRPDILPELKSSAGYRQPTRLRRVLIVAEIAFSVVILFAAGLLTRTLSHLKAIDLGFEPARVISLRVDPGMNGYSQDQSERVFDQILDRLHTQPGISAASLAVVQPLEGGMISLAFQVPGHVNAASDLQTNFNMISPGYFETLSQKFLEGRDFSQSDAPKAPSVAIVNQLFVDQFMLHEKPIGRHFKMGDREVEIVGLVTNSHYQDLREALGPLIYLPAKQATSSGYSLLVRTSLAPKQATSAIRYAIHSLGPKLPIYDMHEMEDVIDHGIAPERVLAFLSSLFSALVTLLCSMGVYGMIAYAVARRTREVGLRMAIGAQKMDVVKLFFRESALLVFAGIATGVPLALACSRLLKSLLYGIEATDVWTLAFTALIFLAVGGLASFFPVRKATRIEPIQALHYE